MTNVRDRKRRPWYETNATCWERGRRRAVCFKAEPDFVVLRLKGTRQALLLPWSAAYEKAAGLLADANRRERRARRKQAAHAPVH